MSLKQKLILGVIFSGSLCGYSRALGQPWWVVIIIALLVAAIIEFVDRPL